MTTPITQPDLMELERLRARGTAAFFAMLQAPLGSEQRRLIAHRHCNIRAQEAALRARTPVKE